MKFENVNINIDYSKFGVSSSDYQPYMTVYSPDNSEAIDSTRKRPTVVICPGGAYKYTSDREAEPVALRFIAADFNAVVLRYSPTPTTFPSALMELAEAVLTLRKNADKWNIDVNKIIICGFSAGGHLAASFCCHWDKPFVTDYFGCADNLKPNGMILGYPVITSGEKAHRGSFEYLLGDEINNKELLKFVSLEKQVNESTPSAFIWHTFTDGSVPVENSLLLASSLAEKNISTELHIFPNGPHGLSLADNSVSNENLDEYKECRAWVDMAIRWIKNL